MTANKRPFYKRLPYDQAFIGARAMRLSNIIARQGDEYYEGAGLTVPSRTTSTILFIGNNGPSSLVEIARALGEQHQLTAQRTALLEDLSILQRKSDPNDQRRKLFELTKRGAAEAAFAEDLCRKVMDVLDDLNNELGFDLGEALDAAYRALSRKSLIERSETILDGARLTPVDE
ncbi:MAG: hypothetical protein AAGL10_07800 [Pseudomonadota bacterium]